MMPPPYPSHPISASSLSSFATSLLLLLLLLFSSSPLPSQVPGCPDPRAINYSPLTNLNDGSCLYPPTSYSPPFLASLSDTIHETSGLALFNGLLWTHNDSGASPRLYGLDTLSGHILRTVVLAGVSNTDWEDLALSSGHLFIGDFGNNNGNRQDLKILRIVLDSLLVSDTLWPELIRFHYPEQSAFDPTPNQTSWDAEAFYHAGDSLHLFTKDWVTQQTRHYILPDQPGDYAALLRDSFDCQGLITGAAINPAGSEIVLCGYRNIGLGIWTCFAWLLYDYPAGKPLGGSRRRIELGTALQLGQMEGVWLNPDFRGWLSGEALSAGPFSQPARLSRFDFQAFLAEDPSLWTPTEPDGPWLRIFPNPSSGLVFWEADNALQGKAWRLVSPLGQLIKQGHFGELTGVLDMGTLPAGLWFLLVDGLPNLSRQIRTGQ